MDYQRCADLHNEIMYRGWTESDRDWLQPQTWWQHQAPSPETASQLSPSLIEFLKRAYLTPNDSRYPYCFFYYLGGLASADDMISNGFLDIAEKNRYVLLYMTSPWNLDDKFGLAFDLHTSTATFIPNYNEAVEICQHRWSWLPLEVILEGYLDMLNEGKVRIVPVTERQDWDYEGPTLVRPWQLYPYTPTDVQKAASAMKRLVDAIDTRIHALPGPAAEPYTYLPWHDPDAFPDELVPASTFAYDFLKAISDIRVRFRYIAPGIRIPTLDEFLNQSYYGDDPLHIFIIETTDDTPSDGPDYGWSQYTIGVQITHANPYDDRHFTNEFHLELPFRVGGNGLAKQSSGQPLGIDPEKENPVPKGSRGELYQAGMSNGFTDYHGVQVHKVLENWAGMVERGDWEVGVDGVLGGIEKFMEADTEEHWEKYTVPHSW
ncbi:hypothetical protein BJX68DRAFT_203099 [Aspergillus pseudodeflectus]|uniref:Uncharacterized protein n=1 Tax=Aspergillus pseudodeflectus TaxID=176178 RepID=A0ABR4KV20_9EURO